MTEQQTDAQVIQVCHAHRPYLVDLAFRMLGDIGAAEDVVQDAFARLLRAPRGEIEDDRGWLIVSQLPAQLSHGPVLRDQRHFLPGWAAAPPENKPCFRLARRSIPSSGPCS